MTDNWDTYNAKPISPWALSVVRAILTHADTIPPTGIYPSADGGLDIEWDNAGDSVARIPPTVIVLEEDN